LKGFINVFDSIVKHMENTAQFNMGLSKLECLRYLLNRAHEERMADDYENYWDVLFSIYLEVENRISKRVPDETAASEHIKRCRAHDVTLRSNAHRGYVSAGTPRAYVDFEIFLRRKIAQMGMDMPDKEETHEGI